MIEEERNGCIDSIVYELTRTSEFRGRKARQYDDPRNAQAVESLKLLAKNAAERGHDYWDLLQPYYDDPDSREWRDAISQTTKEIDSPNKSRSLALFIQRLVRLLSQPSNVAA